MLTHMLRESFVEDDLKPKRTLCMIHVLRLNMLPTSFVEDGEMQSHTL